MRARASRLVRASLALAALQSLMSPGAAQPPSGLNGVYTGTYRCGQGQTNLDLSLQVSSAGEVSGVFKFYLPAGTRQNAYAYRLFGQYDPRTAKFALSPTGWQTAAPPNFAMVGMNGTFDSNELTGTIVGAGCTTFQLDRDQAESGRLAAAGAAPKTTGTPAATTATTAATTGTPAAAAAAAGEPAAPAASTARAEGPGSAAQSDDTAEIEKVLDDIDRRQKERTNPVLTWSMHNLKDLAAGGMSPHPTAFTGLDSRRSIDARVSCNQNGMSVFFATDSLIDDPPIFDWYEDDNGDLVTDFGVRIDGRGHTAKGFPDEELDPSHDQESPYSNVAGIFFYDPALIEREPREQEFATRTGTPLDNLLGPLQRQAAQAEVNDAAATSAGPITDLLNAKSIRVEPSFKDWDRPSYVDLNPQDPVLHKFVTQCAASFGIKPGAARP